MKDILFTDGTPSTWRLMEDGSKRGVGWPVEYNLRVAAGAVVQVKTPAEVAQIPDYKAPVTSVTIPPATVGTLQADLNILANGKISGTVKP